MLQEFRVRWRREGRGQGTQVGARFETTGLLRFIDYADLATVFRSGGRLTRAELERLNMLAAAYGNYRLERQTEKALRCLR